MVWGNSGFVGFFLDVFSLYGRGNRSCLHVGATGKKEKVCEDGL